MTDIDLAAIEARELRLMERLHTKGQIDGQDACTFCDHLWPCDAARLLDALRAAEAREATLREALLSALAQWEMYSDEGRGDLGRFAYIDESTDPEDIEAAKYRDCIAALAPTEPEAER